MATIPQMQPVSSSNLKAVGYDKVNAILYIEFLAGKRSPASLYMYTGVPERIYTGLLGAGSKGEYLFQNIKGIYSYRKVR